MADEIRVFMKVTLTNGYLKNDFESGQLAIDQATQGLHATVVSVGTSEEDMPVGDVATPGVLCIRNLDATNYITYGPKSAGSMVAVGRLEPGDAALLRLDPAATIRWIANTAACKIQMALHED